MCFIKFFYFAALTSRNEAKFLITNTEFQFFHKFLVDNQKVFQEVFHQTDSGFIDKLEVCETLVVYTGNQGQKRILFGSENPRTLHCVTHYALVAVRKKFKSFIGQNINLIRFEYFPDDSDLCQTRKVLNTEVSF